MEALFSKSAILLLEKHLISYKPDINRPADKYPKRTEYVWNSEIRTDIFLAKKKLYKLYLSENLKIGAFVIMSGEARLSHDWCHLQEYFKLRKWHQNHQNLVRFRAVPEARVLGIQEDTLWMIHSQTSSEQKPGVTVLSDYISEWWV